MSVLVFKEKEKALAKAGEEINAFLMKYFGRPILFMSSGGSSLQILNFIREDVLHKNITFTLLDERHGVKEEDLNARQLQKLDFWKILVKKDCDFFDTGDLNTLSLKRAESIFDKFLKKWLQENPDGLIFITLGMGEDGHIAGIKPMPGNGKEFNILFNNSEKLVSGYETKDKSSFSLRLTSTFSMIKKANQIISFISGAGKKDAFQKAFIKNSTNDDCSRLPALFFRELKNINFYTDIV